MTNAKLFSSITQPVTIGSLPLTGTRYKANHLGLRTVPDGPIPGTVLHVNIGEATVTLTTSYTTQTILISQCILRKSTGRGLQYLLPLAIPH